MKPPLQLLAELVEIPGPPGQEDEVRDYLTNQLDLLSVLWTTDPKGNLVVDLDPTTKPKVVVTAHMDEIAMIVRGINDDGSLRVGSMGGLYPWKLGEGPVLVLCPETQIPGVLSFGSIHTDDPTSTVHSARESALEWDMAEVFTGLELDEALEAGIRPGTRVVVHPDRRALHHLANGLVSGYFFDDRADLVSWLLVLNELKGHKLPVLFAATVSEEVGGEGAQYLMHKVQPDVCIALELGPKTPDNVVEISDQPTLWVTDSFAAANPGDISLIESIAETIDISLQLQALSRGGSDASCSASRGLCARHFTLGLPLENSHGFEIMHSGAMDNLSKLTVGLIKRLVGEL